MNNGFSPIISEKAILVVDDSNITRNLIDHVYKDKYKVLMANDGKGAMDIVDVMKDSIVAILLDLNMPDVDGFEVLDYFLENKIMDTIPVCIITGEDAPEIIGKVKTYPVSAILLKPFSTEQIKTVVTKAMELKGIK
ncbi:MAG: response regulator [Bacilli bacterium]|nr:response regulator [Bacilli bacterium]